MENQFFTDMGEHTIPVHVIKGFYMTHDGEGIFPTEMGGEESLKWCTSGVNRQIEIEKFSNVHLDTPNEFELAGAIRIAGCEYESEIGKPRRIGWLDIPLLRYAIRNSDRNILLTSLGILNGRSKIKLCVGYRYQGTESYRVGNETLSMHSQFYTAVPEVLKDSQPLFKEFSGWKCVLNQIKAFGDFPKEFLDLHQALEDFSKAKVRVSIGSLILTK